ncbi:MAG: hypothetical protein Q9163_003625 [Psora crenata]
MITESLGFPADFLVLSGAYDLIGKRERTLTRNRLVHKLKFPGRKTTMTAPRRQPYHHADPHFLPSAFLFYRFIEDDVQEDLEESRMSGCLSATIWERW